MRARVHAHFARDIPDAGETLEVRDRLESSLSGSVLALEQVDCRASVCLVRVSAPSSPELDGFAPMAVEAGLHGESVTTLEQQADRAELIAYVAREGESLPE